MEFFEIMIVALVAMLILYSGYILGRHISRKEWEGKIPGLRHDAIKQSRAVLSGQLSEQIAPYMPDFPYKPTEARFIGKPIDFMIFRGMDSKEIKEVVFVEVKTGKSAISGVERSLKSAIENRKVSWYEYRITEPKN